MIEKKHGKTEREQFWAMEGGQPLEYYKTLGSQGPGAFGLALEHSLSG